MAFEKFGIEMMVRGAGKFARDLGFVASSYVRYVHNIQSVQGQVVRSLQQEINMWERRALYINRSITQNQRAIAQAAMVVVYYQERVAHFQQLVDSGNATPAQRGWLTRYRNLLADAQEELHRFIRTDTTLVNNLTYSNNQVVQSQARLNQALNSSTGPVQALSRWFTVLTGGYGRNLVAQFGLSEALQTGALSASALSLGLDVLKISIDAVTMGITLVIGIFVSIISIFKTATKGVWNLITGIARLAKNILAIPFNWIRNAFGNIGDSLKRIGEIAIGMNLERIIWGIGQKLREVADMAFGAATEFQTLEIRMKGLLALEATSTDSSLTFYEALAQTDEKAKELFDWITNLSITTPFSTLGISNLFTLAESYGYTSEEAKKLTQAIVDFGAGMGLGEESIQRIIENLGQMRAAGKMSGTELRDLARGSFVPINKVFKKMVELAKDGSINIGSLGDELKSLDVTNIDQLEAFAQKLKALGSKGKIETDLFMEAFIEMVNEDFPDAAKRSSTSMKVVISNIQDLIEAMVGLRILKPTFDVISGRLSTFVTSLFTDENKKKAESFGQKLANIFDTAYNISSRITPIAGKFFKAILNKAGSFINTIKDMFTAVFTLDFGKLSLSKNPVVIGLTGILKDAANLLAGSNFQAKIGELWNIILGKPSTSNWTSRQAYSISKQITSMIETIKTNLESGNLKGAFKGVIDLYNYIFKPAVDDLKSVWDSDIWPAISDWYNTTVKPAIVAKGTEIFNDLKTAISGTLGDIGGILIDWGTENEGFFGKISEAVGILMSALAGEANGDMSFESNMKQTGQTAGGLKQAFKDVKDILIQLYEQGLSKVGNWINTSVPGLKPLWDWLATGTVSEDVDDFFQTIMDLANYGGDFLKVVQGLNLLREGVLNLVAAIPEGVSDFFTNLIGLGSIVSTFVDDTLDFESADAFLEKAKTFYNVTEFLNKSVTSFFGIAGKNFGEGLKTEGVNGVYQDVINSVKNMFGDMDFETNTNLATVGAYYDNHWANIKSGYNTLSDDLVGNSIIPDMLQAICDVTLEKLTESEGYYTDYADNIKTTLDTNTLYDTGTYVMQGLYNGMKDKWAEILTWWQSEVAVKLGKIFAAENDIASPSRKFMKYGQYLMEGLAIGIQKSANLPLYAMNNATPYPVRYANAGIGSSNTIIHNHNFALHTNTTLGEGQLIREFGTLRLLED